MQDNNNNTYYQNNSGSNMNQNYNPHFQGYQQNPSSINYRQPMYQNQKPKAKKGFGIASTVLGILSLTLCVLIGIFTGILGFIFAIISFVRKEAAKGLAIAGMITSTLGIVLCIVIWLFIGKSFTAISTGLGQTAGFGLSSLEEEEPLAGLVAEEETVFAGYSYIAGDGSVIYFYEDGTFIWYQSDDNHDDNYYTGTFAEYRGLDATNQIVEELTDYDVTQEELIDYFERNAEDEYYTLENFECLILYNESLVADGEYQDISGNISPYMGFYLNGYYDAANMNSAEYNSFTRIE